MFAEHLTRAIAAARTDQLCHLSTEVWKAYAATEGIHARKVGTRPKARSLRPSPDIRVARSRTRRRLREPRPPATPEIRARVGQWKAEIKAAGLAGHISDVDDKYAYELLTIPSVARGDYSLCSDATMGGRLNVSDTTARRRRRGLEEAGLIEVLGHGKDGRLDWPRPYRLSAAQRCANPRGQGRPGGRAPARTAAPRLRLRRDTFRDDPARATGGADLGPRGGLGAGPDEGVRPPGHPRMSCLGTLLAGHHRYRHAHGQERRLVF
jgi:hypothetical protein